MHLLSLPSHLTLQNYDKQPKYTQICAFLCVYHSVAFFWYFSLMEENLPKAFSVALKEIRTRKKLSQMELAARAGLHLNAVGSLERGLRCPNLNTVYSLSDALKMSMADFMREVDAQLEENANKNKAAKPSRKRK
jgi:DNA-binding XRE family transcriptional regulator